VISALRKLFDGAAAPEPIEDPVATAWARLDEAKGERDRCRAVLIEAEAALQRAQSAITEADAAERDLALAEKAAAAEAARWAESGGKDPPASDAFDAAAAARDRAYRARLRADGVSKALSKLQADIDAARIALEPTEARIDAAAAAIVALGAESEIEALRAEFWPMFKRFTRLCALRNLLTRNVPGTVWADRTHPCLPMTHAADCRAELERSLAEFFAFMREPHAEDSLAMAAPFVESFERLRGAS
jgi:hypothetical protein